MHDTIDITDLVASLSDDARLTLELLRGLKRGHSLIINEGPACEAFFAAKRGAEELVTLGLCEPGVQIPTDNTRLVCKREYRFTETGKRVRNVVLDRVEGRS